MLTSGCDAELEAFINAVVKEENRNPMASFPGHGTIINSDFTAANVVEMSNVGIEEPQQKGNESCIILKSVYYSTKGNGCQSCKSRNRVEVPQRYRWPGKETMTQNSKDSHPRLINHDYNLCELTNTVPICQRIDVLSALESDYDSKSGELASKQATPSSKPSRWRQPDFQNHMGSTLLGRQVDAFTDERMVITRKSTYPPQYHYSQCNVHRESREGLEMSRVRCSHNFVQRPAHHLFESTIAFPKLDARSTPEFKEISLNEAITRGRLYQATKYQEGGGFIKKKSKSFDYNGPIVINRFSIDHPSIKSALTTVKTNKPPEQEDGTSSIRRNSNSSTQNEQVPDMNQSNRDQNKSSICENSKKPLNLNPRTYKCTVDGCSRMYLNRCQFALHLKHHRRQKQQKIYPCPWKSCGKKFRRSDERKRHYRSHTGEKPYECQYCGRRFTRSDHKKTHVRKIHEQIEVIHRKVV